jgi:prepilin-type N-terminal cleavage/methylation domain-containing protein
MTCRKRRIGTARENRSGFTLLELSIVLVIIALVTGMAVQSGISIIETARQNATRQKINTINEALMQYRMATDRLPCPGDLTLTPGTADYGLEAGADASSSIGTGTGVCAGTGMLPQANATGAGVTNTFATAAEGALPAVTMGLSPDFMLDGWGNRFRYAVDTSMTTNNAFASTPVGCTTGAISVNDSNGNARSSSSIYALISQGQNGHGAYPVQASAMSSAGSVNANELTNCHCTSSGTAAAYAPTYVQMQQTFDPGNVLDSFDDVVSYKERWQMRTDWDRPGGCTYLYAIQTGDNRIEGFNAFTGSYANTIGSAANIQQPSNFAIDNHGNFWVANYGNYSNTVAEFSSSGAYLGSYGTEGTNNGQFNGPCCTTIDSGGNLWVTDRDNSRIQEFNISGGVNAMTWMASLGGTSAPCTACLCTSNSTPCPSSSGSGNGQFYTPMAVTFDGAGNIWVADYDNNRVQEFDKSGNLSKIIPDPNNGNPTLYFPSQIAFDGGGKLWVVDGNLEQLDPVSGAQLANYHYGNPSWLESPTGLTYDSITGNLFVGDTGNHEVIEMTTGGTLVRTFGSLGTGNGQFSDVNNYGIYPVVSR